MPAASEKRSSPKGRAPGPNLLVDLANMHDDRIPRFRRRWGRLYGRYTDQVLLERRDELRLLWGYQARHRVLTRFFAGGADQGDERWLEDFDPATSKHSAQLFRRWSECAEAEKEDRSLLQEFICEYWLSQAEVQWSVHWNKKYIGADQRSLPTMLAWLCVRSRDLLKVCRNPACFTPYMLVRRRDQKYCSDACAIPAQREAKRRWWHKQKAQRAAPKPSARRTKTNKGGRK